MKSSTKRFTSALLALLLLIGAFIVFFDMVQPAYDDMMQLKGKLATENTLLENESSTIAQVSKVMATYRDQGGAQAAMNLSLPVGQDISDALAQIYGLAQASNIAIQNTAISVSVPPGGAYATTQDVINTNAVGLTLRPTGTIALSLTANGSYEGFMNFLFGLETNVRIFDVKQVSIQPIAVSGKTSGGQDSFNYLVTVNTYYQLP